MIDIILHQWQVMVILLITFGIVVGLIEIDLEVPPIFGVMLVIIGCTVLINYSVLNPLFGGLPIVSIPDLNIINLTIVEGI